MEFVNPSEPKIFEEKPRLWGGKKRNVVQLIGTNILNRNKETWLRHQWFEDMVRAGDGDCEPQMLRITELDDRSNGPDLRTVTMACSLAAL